MGEFTNFNDSPEASIDKEKAKVESPPEGKVETAIKGCYADGINKRDNLPVFKVSHEEFWQNMNYGRKRVRFKTDGDAAAYMRRTYYKQPFWIQHSKDNYMRKVK